MFIYNSPEWIKNKKAIKNPKNKKYDKCFQYVLTAALNYQNIKNNPERISKIKSFVKKYNWKEINFSPHQEDWDNFEKNNKSTALNVLFVPHNTRQIRHAYLSKHNSDRKNQVILLMITDGKKWHYLAVKKLSTLLKGITSKRNGDLYCSFFFIPVQQKLHLKNMKMLAKIITTAI